MENELQTNLDEILLDKETNLLPENLKEGVTVLGVEGSLRIIGSDSNIKLFETVEDMNNDPNPKEDDLAVVYREELQPFKEDTETQFITFPEQVVLDKPFTDNVYGMIEAVDSSVIFYGNVMFYGDMFEFQSQSETGMIQVRYESQDQITWTRTQFMNDGDTLTNPVDLGTIVKWEPMQPFNNVIGKFMLVGGNYFEGLYQYTTYVSDSSIYLYKNLHIQDNEAVYDDKVVFNFNDIEDTLHTFMQDNGRTSHTYFLITLKDNVVKLYYDYITTDYADTTYYYIENNLWYAAYENNSHTELIKCDKHIEINLLDNSIQFVEDSGQLDMTSATAAVIYYFDHRKLQNSLELIITNVSDTKIFLPLEFASISEYLPANSQLNLVEPNQILKDVSAYGSNGIITGDGSITNASNSFDDIPAMLYSEIQAKYDNMEPIILTNENHIIEDIISNNIYTIPTKSDGTPLLDTSNVTNCYNMFQGCKNLKSIPNLEFNNISNAYAMFAQCSNISDINSIDLSNCNNASCMFNNCNKLNTINVTNVENIENTYTMFGNTNITEVNDLNFASVTNADRTFQHCHNITSVNNVNVVAAGRNIGYMFDRCYNLKHVDNFYFNTNNISNVFSRAAFESTSDLNIDWSKITSVDNLFYGCNNLYDIYNFSMNNVENVNDLFKYCINIKELPSNYLQDNFPNAIYAKYTFESCTNLYLENNSFYSDKLCGCIGLFGNCVNIKHIDNLYIPLCNSTVNMFSGCSNLSSIDNVTFNTLTNCYGMFKNCKSLTQIPNLQYNRITNVAYMFQNCMDITTIDKEMNLSNCNCVNYMFHNSGLENVDMSKIKFKSTLNSVTSLFSNCAKLKTVTNIDFSGTNINNYINLFNGCTSLSDNIQIQESNNMYNCFAMFMNCTNFKNIPNINYNNIQYCADWMFYSCTNITTINNLNLSKVNRFDYGFTNCTNLTTVSNLNLYNVSKANSIFKNCTNLTTINNIIFNKINTSLYSTFQGCTNLINAPSMEINNCINIRDIFRNCINLVNIPIYNTSKINICSNFVNGCPNLSNDSLNNILQMCADMNCTYNLNYIGLTEDQANICMNLSNYQNFINAGWTTGY